jgi:hypothetical protein
MPWGVTQYSNGVVSGGGGGGGSAGGAGGFGGGGGFNFNPPSAPAQVTYSPSQFNSSVQQNPQIQALQDEAQKYQGSLAAGNDADAQLAMQRQRDLASGMAAEGLGGARNAGFGSDTGYAQQRRLKGLDASQMAQASLNTGLTSDARKQQLAALQARGGLAADQAQITQGQQNYNLQQWQAQNQANLGAAQLQASQNQAAYAAQMQAAQLAASMANSFYTGF